MTAREPDFGVASLVRCSFCKMKGGECKTSGDVIPTAFTNADTLGVIERCAATQLTTLPSSVKRVVLLGTADAYVKKTRAIFSGLYTNFSSVNEVAFRAAGALWIYAAHPSPSNGHFKSWVSGAHENATARKRVLAQRALADA